MKWTIILAILMGLFSCKNEKANVKVDNITGKILTIPNYKNTILDYMNRSECKNKYKIFYVFDGDCSVCIGDYINWNTTWNKDPYPINCIFISTSVDNSTLEYYSDNNNVKLTKCQYIIQDTNNAISDSNAFLNPGTNILLLDENNKIIASKNPFIDHYTNKIYAKALKEY